MNAPVRAVDFRIPVPPVERPPARHRFTVDAVRNLTIAEILHPDANLELLDGEIIDMPSEGEAHISLKIALNKWFVRNLPEGFSVAPDATLHLAPGDAPEPDFYVLTEGAPLKPIDPAEIQLIVEISDNSLAHDLNRKAPKYAAYGLVEYWVIDINARVTHVFTEPANGSYAAEARVAFDQPLRPTRLPDLLLDLAVLQPSRA